MTREIIPEMTYKDLDTEDSDEKMRYLWSLLYNTGYLTDAGKREGRMRTLMIPNREVELLFEQQILG